MKLVTLLGALSLGFISVVNAQVQVEGVAGGLHRGGSIQVRSVNGKAVQPRGTTGVLVFDSFTTAASLTSTGSSPRTFMGVPFTMANTSGTVMINQVVVYLAASTAATYTDVALQLQFWDVWSSTASPVFSSPSGGIVTADLGPLTTAANNFYEVTLTLNPPVALNGLANHGFAINYMGNTGAGLVATDNLTSLLRFGNAFDVGSNPLADYGYRNASGRTDLNFLSTDARSFGNTFEGMALQLTAAATTPVSLQSFSVE